MKLKITILWCFLGYLNLLNAQSLVGEIKTINTNKKHFTCVGRHYLSPKKSIVYSLPGVTIYTAFTGSYLDLLVKDLNKTNSHTNYLSVIIDDKEPITIQINHTDSIYHIANNLTNTKHSLKIIKRTESFVGTIEFSGIRIHKTAKISKYSNLPTNKFMFIGNSITCGYGNDTSITTNPGTGFTSKNENNYTSYGHLASRQLNAQYLAFAYSGRGLYKNYDGSIINPIPEIFDQIIPDNSTYKWDHNKYQPDIIFCNLGTNDFSSETNGFGKIDSVTFCAKYVKFTSELSKLYPKSKIVLLVGSMMSDYYPSGGFHWTRIQNYVKSVVNTENLKNKNKFYFLAFSPQESPYGEDWHPSLQTHTKMSNQLIDFIKSNTLLK